MEKSDAQRIDKNRFISILNTPFERAALIDDYSWDYSGYYITSNIRDAMTEFLLRSVLRNIYQIPLMTRTIYKEKVY